jgi:LmbE family N-acetylglucosaminyl deacetylase
MGNESNKRVLAVMAHPDDVEMMASGTLFRLKDAGWDIGIISMTAGDCGSTEVSREEISRTRVDEARDAADYLGAWYRCGGFQDMEIFANAEGVRKLTELFRAFKPSVVITHPATDYIPDHEETSRLARSAAFAVAMPLYQTKATPPAQPAEKTPALYYADPVEGVDLQGRRAYPHFYVDISSKIDQKATMLSKHESQREWLRSHHGMDKYLEQMRDWASTYGQEIGVEYAEGFRQHRGHGYPRDPRLQDALEEYVYAREETVQ